VAAATTSLPEIIGADLNFDYRFAWLRDLSLTIRSLWIAACPDEPSRLFDWFATAAGHNGGTLVQIMYGVEGERDSPNATSTTSPATGAAGPSASATRHGGRSSSTSSRSPSTPRHPARLPRRSRRRGSDMLVTLANRAASSWREPDAGMWEAPRPP
jgi:hypothetical protein